jgi:hypothetical protein
MLGDSSDMAGRMRALLPNGWFADDAPVLTGLLQGIGTAWSCIYFLIEFAIQQSRISTATGIFLDMISSDFFGSLLPRVDLEPDSLFLQRIKYELLRPRATREALILALQELTGRAPIIFEPRLTSDTGGYTLGGVGYNTAGGWGNISLPFQVFVTVYRPRGIGIANIAGYGTGGIPVYGNSTMEPPQMTDAQIYSAIPPLLPAATVAWTRLSD